jgi:hypothetical protein
MIELLMIFDESGLLLKKVDCRGLANTKIFTEDLLSGFFSVIFQYISTHFGKIRLIQSEQNLIIIQQCESIFVTLIINLFHPLGSNQRSIFAQNREIWLVNKRLEEIGINILSKCASLIRQFLGEFQIPSINEILNTDSMYQLDVAIKDIIKNAEERIESLKKTIDQKLDVINCIYDSAIL